jgi:adenosylcobinamide-phosphate synthase
MVTAHRWHLGRWTASSAVALVVDALLGDEPLRPHPVAVFGNAMMGLERRMWDDRRMAGICYALSGIGAAALAGTILESLPGGALAAGYATVAGRGLWESARAVASALESGDLTRARELLPSLVGRDPAELSQGEIARATVESVAENTVDGIVAPALFTAVGGAGGALVYRGINTLDSMVGYRGRYERFGWASARVDDAANFVPARVTAVLVAAVRPSVAREIWDVVRRDAPLHPSPNAGVAEAAFAAALGVRLGGTSSYGGRLEERPGLGPIGAREPEVGDIEAAVRCSQHVTVLLFGALMAAAVSLGRHRRPLDRDRITMATAGCGRRRDPDVEPVG